MSVSDIVSADHAFARYEAVRHRFPQIDTSCFAGKEPGLANGLSELSSYYDAFVFDAFGVLNIGDTPISGARAAIETLRDARKQIFVLTNAASYDFSGVVEKFSSLGFSFADTELISSRAVCERALASYEKGLSWGVMASEGFLSSSLEISSCLLGDDASLYDQVDRFLFLSASHWTWDRQALLIASLSTHPRQVVVANPDLVAPRETGLSLEPGYFAQDLLDHVPGLEVSFHGKPFPSVYDAIEERLSVPAERIAMIGDSLHTDILGARVRGWGSVLVTGHGFLKGQDVSYAIERSGIVPDWIVQSI